MGRAARGKALWLLGQSICGLPVHRDMSTRRAMLALPAPTSCSGCLIPPVLSVWFTLYRVFSRSPCWAMGGNLGKTLRGHVDQPGPKLQSRGQRTMATFPEYEAKQTWV